MPVFGRGIDRRSIMGVGAEKTIGHLVHMRLANEAPARRKQPVDYWRIESSGWMACRPNGIAVARYSACDLDVFFDRESCAAKRAARAARNVERNADGAKIAGHVGFR